MTTLDMARPTKRLFVYLLPVLHISACLISMVGYIVPSLQYLGIVWAGIMLVDLPVSVVAYALAWQHGTIATVWIVVMGTLWWCLLGVGADLVVHHIRSAAQTPDAAQHAHSAPTMA